MKKAKAACEKTNVMRILDQKRIAYVPHFYDEEARDGLTIARLNGEDPDATFKTLVTMAGPGRYYVFVIPVNCTLNLKRAAKAVEEKALDMLPQKELLPLTGYIHGGCSPIGMKKALPTVLHETAILFDRIYFSAGRVGAQVEVAPSVLTEAFSVTLADVADAIEVAP